ncbi:hypothetical protein [Nocardia sp. N2S4-5]|uniref:hypothetical protein n=1 Tax=Nocardia sp. N2S4-5 TaxID=3351565 RepID=UPI0037D5FA15
MMFPPTPALPSPEPLPCRAQGGRRCTACPFVRSRACGQEPERPTGRLAPADAAPQDAIPPEPELLSPTRSLRNLPAHSPGWLRRNRLTLTAGAADAAAFVCYVIDHHSLGDTLRETACGLRIAAAAEKIRREIH